MSESPEPLERKLDVGVDDVGDCLPGAGPEIAFVMGTISGKRKYILLMNSKMLGDEFKS
jgi:hypothetical protein